MPKKDKDISIVVSSRKNDEESNKFIDSIKNTVGCKANVVFVVNDNSMGLSKLYYNMMNNQQITSDVVVFCHDDIEFLKPGWGDEVLRLFNKHKDYGIIGVAGSAEFDERGAWWNYNKKYGRIGHLLQDRFKSEPCNDSGYFITLFRYIHQNPVKAGLVKAAKDYEFSSWGNDYLGLASQRVCHTEAAIKRYGMEELVAWVDMPLPEMVGCIDMDDKAIIADEAVRELLLKKCGARTIPEFQLHTKQRKKDIVRDVMRELGVGPRQMVRVSGMTYTVIYKLWKEL